MTEAGIFASRSICNGSTCSSRKALRVSRKRSPFSTAVGSSGGWGWIRSRRKLPRNSSLPKLGSLHSASRAASTTSRASCSVTLTDIGSALLRCVGRRLGRRDVATVCRQALNLCDLWGKHGRKLARSHRRAYERSTTGFGHGLCGRATLGSGAGQSMRPRLCAGARRALGAWCQPPSTAERVPPINHAQAETLHYTRLEKDLDERDQHCPRAAPRAGVPYPRPAVRALARAIGELFGIRRPHRCLGGGSGRSGRPARRRRLGDAAQLSGVPRGVVGDPQGRGGVRPDQSGVHRAGGGVRGRSLAGGRGRHRR